MQYPEHIGKILAQLEDAGEEAYIVGGSLRDALLGKEANDFDIATSALPQKTLSVFSDRRVIETGLKHGTVTVIVNKEPVEITTFRIDGEYSDSRHPDTISFTSRIEEDLSRRDFTINAMAYSPLRGITDPFNGKEDLDKKIIRAVRDPYLRFSEDALRIMRAFRFSAQLGFEIEENTLNAAIQMSHGLEKIAKERICVEFIKLITSSHAREALILMRKSGVLPYVIGNTDIEDALIDALPHMPRTDVARLGIIFANTEQEAARSVLRSLKCSNKQIIGALAIARGAKMHIDSPVAATALKAETGEYAKAAARASELLGISPIGAERLVDESYAPTRISELAIGGKELIALGAKGKEIGAILDELLSQAMRSPEKNEKETLTEIAKGLLNERRA